MTRRTFLKLAGKILASATVAATLPPVVSLPKPKPKLSAPPLCISEEALAQDAQAMVEPLRRQLDYQAIGRKLLLVDELPNGALSRYERDVAAVAHAMGRSWLNVPSCRH